MSRWEAMTEHRRLGSGHELPPAASPDVAGTSESGATKPLTRAPEPDLHVLLSWEYA